MKNPNEQEASVWEILLWLAVVGVLAIELFFP